MAALPGAPPLVNFLHNTTRGSCEGHEPLVTFIVVEGTNQLFRAALTLLFHSAA